MIQFFEKTPTPPLALYIESFWRLEGAGKKEKIFPDGRMEMVFNLSDPFRRYHTDGSTEIQPPALLVGQMRDHTVIEPTGRIHLFGIRFQPGGAFPFLQFALDGVTDKIQNLDAVWGRLAEELTARLAGAGNFDSQVLDAERILMRRLHTDGDNKIAYAVQQIISSGGNLILDRLVSEISLSARQIERKFQERVGIGPKLLARLVRFQKVFRLLGPEPNPRWVEIALHCGYYDQAHFIRDFKEFTGEIPSSYLVNENTLGDFFTRKHRVSDFSNTLA